MIPFIGFTLSVIDPHTSGSSDTFYELGRIALTFGLIGTGVWIVIKLMLRSGQRALGKKHHGSNRRQRRADRAKMKRKRRQSAEDRRASKRH